MRIHDSSRKIFKPESMKYSKKKTKATGEVVKEGKYSNSRIAQTMAEELLSM